MEVRREQQTRLVVMLQEPGLAGCRKAAGGCSGDRILPRRQVDTETEHKHFMHRVKGAGLWQETVACAWQPGLSVSPQALASDL